MPFPWEIFPKVELLDQVGELFSFHLFYISSHCSLGGKKKIILMSSEIYEYMFPKRPTYVIFYTFIYF